MVQVEVKGRVNLDKLTAFLEELRVSRSRTVSLGTLMCARDASAADNTHIVEVRCCYRCSRPVRLEANGMHAFAALYVLLLSGNHRLNGVDRCTGRAIYPTADCTAPGHCIVFALRFGAWQSLQRQCRYCRVCVHGLFKCICSRDQFPSRYMRREFCQYAVASTSCALMPRQSANWKASKRRSNS